MSKKKSRKKSKVKIGKGAPVVIKNCTAIGVQYDAKALDTITMLASALEENAAAIGALARVLRASNVNVEALFKVTQEPLKPQRRKKG